MKMVALYQSYQRGIEIRFTFSRLASSKSINRTNVELKS
ncbi:hypothetical protein SAMN05444280_1276 [Tangfeifania diversioriginum]|uniref:Uncharacterized protein n=1 Tax=Tangfeifania diversioriginum TaxID=1168035 RepID=A0A1M6LIT0_9BACT|nr:hypothetical protein SAMN05444280_1276 [Tangfeifania diversioriginum]